MTLDIELRETQVETRVRVDICLPAEEEGSTLKSPVNGLALL